MHKWFIHFGSKRIEIVSVLLISGGINILTGLISGGEELLLKALFSIGFVMSGVFFFILGGNIEKYEEKGGRNWFLAPVASRQEEIYFIVDASKEDPTQKDKDVGFIIWAIISLLASLVLLAYQIGY